MYTNALVGMHMVAVKMCSLLPQCVRWVPVYTGADKMLAVMSIGFLLEHKDDAVVWRGPKKNGMVAKEILLSK